MPTAVLDQHDGIRRYLTRYAIRERWAQPQARIQWREQLGRESSAIRGCDPDLPVAATDAPPVQHGSSAGAVQGSSGGLGDSSAVGPVVDAVAALEASRAQVATAASTNQAIHRQRPSFIRNSQLHTDDPRQHQE